MNLRMNLRLMLSVQLCLAFFSMIGCATSKITEPAELQPVHSAIIFVPGFYGSALKDARSGDRFFISASEYIFGSKAVSLHVGELATPDSPELELDGVLEGVRLIPGLYTYDVYGKFLNSLRDYATETHQELVPFAYDWRKDLSEDAKRLGQTVDDLQARGIRDIKIVAHSMGCLITTYYLAYGVQEPEKATLNWSGALKTQRAVLMAGPYRGVFSLFRNMQTGATIGGNHTFMPAETVASLPSSYQLLPFPDFHLLKMNGINTSLPLDDYQTWKKLQLGLFHNQTLPSQVQERRTDYVDHQLKRAVAFSHDIQLPLNSASPPPKGLKVLQLVGSGHPVVDSAYWDSTKDGFCFDTDPLEKLKLSKGALFLDGDGSVTVRSARLPPALEPNTRVLHSTMVHEKIFEDEVFRNELREFLR